MVKLLKDMRGSIVAVISAMTCASFAAEAPQTQQRNSLGVAFIEVPGLDVKFAQWETRVRDFEAFVSASGYEWNEKPFFAQTGDHPVVNVNLSEARTFCEWLTKREQATGALAANLHYRLPTNSEWDAAAGCQSQRTGILINNAAKLAADHKDVFPWGTQWPPPPRAGNFNSRELHKTDDGFEFTAPVGSFDADTRGLYDMAGNVWEWTSDGDDGSSPSATLRGGSWQYLQRECLLSSYRYVVPIRLRRPSVGFRCVLANDEDPAQQRAATERRSKELIARPSVNNLEVEKMKEQMMRNKATRVSEPGRSQSQDGQQAQVSDAEKLAIWSRLVRGGAEKYYVNSLGVAFEPSPSGRALRAGRELRLQDMAPWRAEQADTRTVFESTEGTITSEIAAAFCKWLTALEHGQRKIPSEFAYRAALSASDGNFLLELSTNQSAMGN